MSEETKEYYRQYYKDHKDSIRKSQEKWNKKNIKKVFVISARNRAKQKGWEFNLTEDDIIIPEICPVFKIPFCLDRALGKRFNGPSLDRIDSSKGYIKGNIQIISDLANRMKQDATVEQLKLFGEWTRTL